MSNETAYQAVRKYINKVWEARRRTLPQGTYAAELAEKDGALKWLEFMKRTSTPLPQERSSSLEEE